MSSNILVNARIPEQAQGSGLRILGLEKCKTGQESFLDIGETSCCGLGAEGTICMYVCVYHNMYIYIHHVCICLIIYSLTDLSVYMFMCVFNVEFHVILAFRCLQTDTHTHTRTLAQARARTHTHTHVERYVRMQSSGTRCCHVT